MTERNGAMMKKTLVAAAEVTNVVRGEIIARKTDEVALDLRRFETAVLLTDGADPGRRR